MSRRAPNPAADRAAQNQLSLKTLVKVESNKTCADCKRNKHPRWASWNIGIFLCIRCSGIHRGMGTHISRVKSVDLDAWTDEQLQSMLRWGNARANKYWEAKLAQGHVPAEAKIENFIRTKYDSKRWVMDGGMPDPATLDAPGDDEVPLNIVQEKAKLDRASSVRTAPGSVQPPPPPKNAAPTIDLFDDGASPPSHPVAPRSSSAVPSVGRPAPGSNPGAQPQKQNKTGDSLLGFDFFGSASSSAPGRPSSAAATSPSSNVPSRPDLKQSILSLYASAPRSSTQSQPSHSRSGSTSQPDATTISNKSQSPSSGLDDAFGNLSFSSTTAQSPPSSSRSMPFANLSSPTLQRPVSGSAVLPPSKPTRSIGNFFTTGTTSNSSLASPPIVSSSTVNARPERGLSASSGFGDFAAATSPSTAAQPANTSAKGLEDMWGWSNDAASKDTNPSPPKAPEKTKPSTFDSPFNLSSPKQPEPPKSSAQTSGIKASSASASGLMNMNPWGADNAWASSAPAPQASPPAAKATPAAPVTSDSWGWGNHNNGSIAANNAPRVAADEDFGGWESSATPVAAAPPQATNAPPNNPAKSTRSTFTASEDLFSNVWE